MGVTYALFLLGSLIVAWHFVTQWMIARGWIKLDRKAVRRGTGHAMLGLQAFVEPRIEHVIAAEREEQLEDQGGVPDDEPLDPNVLRAELAVALSRPRIDPDEIRGLLATAFRAGLDWRALYLEAERAECAARPYRAPSVPPLQRVAPRE